MARAGAANKELGEFLRARRALLTPAAAGVVTGGRRRVPGLRREELAELAGVSPEYYTRLERGHHPSVSPSVLDALAEALRLQPEERDHLLALAAGPDRTRRTQASDEAPSPEVERALALLGTTPAIVCGAYADIVAFNEAAGFLYIDFGALPPAARNTVHWMLLAPLARELYDEVWEETATEMIGALRADIGRRGADARSREIVQDLAAGSALFRRVWRQHEISTCLHDVKTLAHPRAGAISIKNEVMVIRSAPDHVFYLMAPLHQEAFAAALREHGGNAGARDAGAPA
jgi:transcriptional regulator with XRE-family HTH domain